VRLDFTGLEKRVSVIMSGSWIGYRDPIPTNGRSVGVIDNGDGSGCDIDEKDSLLVKSERKEELADGMVFRLKERRHTQPWLGDRRRKI